jgi:magnesium-transporting ATPase (P-type)
VIDHDWDLSQTYVYLTYTPLRALRDALNALTLAIIIIVVAVPEGLPTMIAIVLSLNMRRLLKSQVGGFFFFFWFLFCSATNLQVLVRKLLGIETAGSLSLLFVDKTGTLTKVMWFLPFLILLLVYSYQLGCLRA